MLKTPGESPFYAKGLRFSCTRCSACCRYESGYVFLSGKDAFLLGTTLKMGYSEFTKAYCRWVPGEKGKSKLSLREKFNKDCIFWSPEKAACSVYEARPVQCRAFPFWSSVVASEYNWKLTAINCPGMDHGALHSTDSIEKWLAIQENEPIISRSAG